MNLSETQQTALLAIKDCAENAFREESAFWDCQKENTDHRRPDWLIELGNALDAYHETLE